MSVLIRNAETGDLPTLLEIVNEAILNTTSIYDYSPRTLTEQQNWFAEKKAAGHPVLVAEKHGEVAGFATYGQFRVKMGYRFSMEHSVYVSPHHHGQGMGSLLLENIIDHAREQGHHTLLGCIDASNKGSIAFHEKFGFEYQAVLREVGYKFGRWLDLVIMQKIL